MEKITKENQYLIIAVAEIKTHCNKEKERIKFLDAKEKAIAIENVIQLYYAFYRLASFISYRVAPIEPKFERTLTQALDAIRLFYDEKLRHEKDFYVRSEIKDRYRKCLQHLKDLKELNGEIIF